MKAMYCQYCGELLEDGCNCEREIAEAEQERIDDYYDRPDVRYGLAQQDLIDTWRFER